MLRNGYQQTNIALVKNASKCQKTLFKVANELLDKNNERVFPQHTDSKQLANDFNHFYVDKIHKFAKRYHHLYLTNST